MTAVPPKILVVEDAPSIRHLLVRFLAQKNYRLAEAGDGTTALELFEQFEPDLVILDINLPDMLGFNLCELMQRRRDVFVLILTGRTDSQDKREGFLRGADDYLTKPFDLEEVAWRVQAILKRQRRTDTAGESALIFEDLAIDPQRREVKLDDQPVKLTVLEFNLLYWLASHPGRVWTRSELLQQVWHTDYEGGQRVVDVHIRQIRQKIENNRLGMSFIETVRGIGYKFHPLTNQVSQARSDSEKIKSIRTTAYP